MRRTVVVLLCLFALLATILASCTVKSSRVGPRKIALEPDLVIGSEPDRDGVLLHHVNSIVVDSHGDLYFGDFGLYQIDHFSDSGEFLGKFGSAGAGPGELMDLFVMGIDDRDRLAFAGIGGRVTLLDTEGKFLDEFIREESGPSTYSLKFDSSGSLYIVSPVALHHQVIQVYSPQWKLLRSFGDTYAVGKEVDIRDEGFHAAGYLDIGPKGALYYVQRTPYELRKYTPDGALLASTDEGAGDFVPPPPVIDYTHGSFKVGFPGGSTGIEVRPDSLVITTAYRRLEDGAKESMLCCYDAQLHLLASERIEGIFSLLGHDPKGRIFVRTETDTGPLVTRYRLHLK